MATRRKVRDLEGPDYGQLLDDFCEAQTKADEEANRIRSIAGDEADKRIRGWLSIAAAIFAAAIWGWRGVWVAVALFLALVAFGAWEKRRRRGAERHLIPGEAEDVVRLKITAEAHAAGERCWRVEPDKQSPSQTKVFAVDSARWDNAEERIYRTAVEFAELSPLARRKRLRAVAKDARSALEAGEKLAKDQDAKLVFWAERALFDLRRG